MKRLRHHHLRKGPPGKGRVVELDLLETAAEGVGLDGLGYLVNFRSGREGAPLQEGTRTTLPVSLERAERILARELQRRLADGYAEAGGAPQGESQEDPTDCSDSPPACAPTIVGYLANPRSAPGDWPHTRIIQRAGQLRLRAAVPHLVAEVPRSSGLLEVVLAWALARIADPGSVGALKALAGARRSEPARRFATAGLLAIPSSSAATREALLDELPRGIGRSVENDSPEGLQIALDRHLEGQAAGAPLVLVTLALLDTPAIRSVLKPTLGRLALRPPCWQALRRIYKLAEMRDDGELWGILAGRIEHSRAQPGTRWGTTWTRASGRVNIADAARQGSDRWGFTHPTRQWFRRRTSRTLRIRGNDGCRGYVDMALGLLAAVDKQERGRPSWPVGHLLLKHSRAFVEPGRIGRWSPPWRGGSDPQGARTEAFPELWDARPDALLALARGGHTPFGIPVGCTALLERSDLGELASPEQAVQLLGGAHPLQVRLGLRIARAWWDPSQPSRPLLLALAGCANADARALAHGWIRDVARVVLLDPAFLLALVRCGPDDTHDLARELIPGALTVPGVAEAFVGGLLDLLTADDLDPASPDIDRLGALLTGVLAAHLRSWPLGPLQALLSAKVVAAQRLGSRLLARHDTPAEQLPEDLLAAWTTASDAEVRAEGVRVFSTLPDTTLQQRFAVLMAMLSSPVGEVRAAIAPTIARLSAAHSDFANSVLHAIFAILRAEEGAEGLHAELASFAEAHLGEALDKLDERAIQRLLSSESTQAQALGAARLDRLRPDRLSPAQVVALCGHDLRAVRAVAQAWVSAEVDRYVHDDDLLLRLIDADWPGTRALGAELLRAHRSDGRIDANLLVAICDSPKAEVQALGRQLIPDLFASEHGPLLLARLAEHPSTDMQRFVSGLLPAHAAGHPDRIIGLFDYFAAVLGGVSRGGVAKARVFAFLDQESQRDRAIAELAVPLLARISASCSVQDRARAIAILGRIRRTHGLSSQEIRLRPPEARAGGVRAL